MPHIQSGNDYYLLHEYSGKYVCTGATDDGGPIHLWGPIPPGHEPRYKFKVIAVGESYCYLLHEYSGKYVCTRDTANGTNVVIWGSISPGDEARFRFQIIVAGTGGGADYYVQQQLSDKFMCTGEVENGGLLYIWGPMPPGHEPRYRYQLSPA